MSHCWSDSGSFFDTCDRAPKRLESRDVYVNALSATLPACDRKEPTVDIERLEQADTCYVYCAQRTCDAAKDLLHREQQVLEQKCKRVVYLPGGALEMPVDTLVDGDSCRSQIVTHATGNARSSDATRQACVTCVTDQTAGTPTVPPDEPIPPNTVTVSVAGGPPTATALHRSEGKIPEWYMRQGIYSPLPPQFTCDARYKDPAAATTRQPVAHNLTLDIRKSGLDPNATIGYWAAKPNPKIVPAAEAYDRFQNSGIAHCAAGECDLRVDLPGSYIEAGAVYPPHIHFTQWERGRWDPVVKTVEVGRPINEQAA